LQHDIHEIKQKLAKVHKVNIEDITIISITEGSLKVNYTVNHLTPEAIDDLRIIYEQEFDKYQSYDIHASF
jgi:DNA-directed RNA polymerase subunit F